MLAGDAVGAVDLDGLAGGVEGELGGEELGHRGFGAEGATGVAQGGARIIHNKAYPVDGFPEVHARKGEACPVCGDEIIKIKVGPRGTYLCPTCQPEPQGRKSVS